MELFRVNINCLNQYLHSDNIDIILITFKQNVGSEEFLIVSVVCDLDIC